MLKKFIQFFFLSLLFFSQTSLRAEVFSQKEQEEAFAFVLKEMFYQEKKPIPIPKVLNVLDVPDEKYAQQCDFCDNKRIYWYSKKFNEIWILAHRNIVWKINLLKFKILNFTQLLFMSFTS